MGVDYEKSEKFIIELEEIKKYLEEKCELFSDERLSEFSKEIITLKKNIEISKQDSRKLNIGVVGDVKAGKSSFLNACLFEGKDYLPKAATPMTAALTKISYSEEQKAIIHFYNQEDWEIIKRESENYDKKLNAEYEKYCNSKEILDLKKTLESKENYEKSKFKKDVSEIQLGAKEITEKVDKDFSLLEYLGKMIEVKVDIISKLNEYIGAEGKFTPIVSYVELMVNNPKLKDIEIVDTPGLNDPIVSRGLLTKDFLKTCDVVILLSPCSQFMTANAINLMTNSLPSAGVNEIIVVGSKLDSGILNEEPGIGFLQAYKKSIDSYKSQFIKNIEKVKSQGRNLDILSKLDCEKVLFTSSICYVISKKKKEGLPLFENEKQVLNNLKKYINFKEEYISSLSGIGKVHDSLEEVLKNKSKIFENKNSKIIEISKQNNLETLDNILHESTKSIDLLKSCSLEELKERSNSIRNIIDLVRIKLLNAFESAKIKCEERIQQILPQLTLEIKNNQNISIKESHEIEFVEDSKWFGLKKITKEYDIKHNDVSISDVINNIKHYAARCEMLINSEFGNFFNKDEFSRNIKEIVLIAFNKSDKNFDEDEIIIPVQNVLSKISIPNISLDFSKYIDEINTVFKYGYARDNEIHQLSSIQLKILNNIEKDLRNQLKNMQQNISDTLQKQGVSFADNIEKVFCDELEKLQKQVKEKEYYISEYEKLSSKIKEFKNLILEY